MILRRSVFVLLEAKLAPVTRDLCLRVVVCLQHCVSQTHKCAFINKKQFLFSVFSLSPSPRMQFHMTNEILGTISVASQAGSSNNWFLFSQSGQMALNKKERALMRCGKSS